MRLLILFLILIPIIFSFLFLVSSKRYYKPLSYFLFALCSILAITVTVGGPTKILISGLGYSFTEGIMLILEIAILVYLYRVSIKHKRWSTFALVVVQTLITFYSLFFLGKEKQAYFNIDKLSLVMLLIINIVGTLIVVFANGYMNLYEEHRKMKSRQKLFYFVICIFLAAMNGIVLSDSLSWVYFFWEITTLSSFILISYNNDKEAFDSGFRALFINLIGGLCFSIGNILFQNMMDITTLSQIIEKGKVTGIYILPAFLLCIAGFAKSAQMPFQSWLLGAMVAPTPVSALLHSSTMVKAGVYLIIKLSPAYAGTRLGTAIAIYGGFTFLLCSAIAVSQQNAKRVLAYSTIANLGLIICSAGMGTGIAISAAIILIVFHAVSKALLFLCTGQIEHTIGSRQIEDMTGLVHVAPLLAIITSFAIVSMILPPFGVLVTKWLSIEASASNPFVVIFLVLGSALTTLYYVKWMGALLSYPVNDLKAKNKNDITIYLPLWILSILVLLTSLFLTPIYNFFISPEVTTLLKARSELSVMKGNLASQTGSFNNALVFIVLGVVIVISLLVRKMIISSADMKNVYMCGENNSTEDGENYFRSGDGVYVKANVSNFYLSVIFDENTITNLGYIISVSLLLIVIIGGIL